MDSKKQPENKELLSIREVAELFGVHQQTLRRWDEQGKLKAIRVGEFGHRKYQRSEIEALIEKKGTDI